MNITLPWSAANTTIKSFIVSGNRLDSVFSDLESDVLPPFSVGSEGSS